MKRHSWRHLRSQVQNLIQQTCLQLPGICTFYVNHRFVVQHALQSDAAQIGSVGNLNTAIGRDNRIIHGNWSTQLRGLWPHVPVHIVPTHYE